MSMIIIPNVWKEEKPFKYYSLHIWHNSKTMADETYDYEDCSNALSVLKNRIEHDNIKIELATVREHTIFRRTEETEISISSPLLHYNYQSGFSI